MSLYFLAGKATVQTTLQSCSETQRVFGGEQPESAVVLFVVVLQERLNWRSRSQPLQRPSLCIFFSLSYFPRSFRRLYFTIQLFLCGGCLLCVPFVFLSSQLFVCLCCVVTVVVFVPLSCYPSPSFSHLLYFTIELLYGYYFVFLLYSLPLTFSPCLLCVATEVVFVLFSCYPLFSFSLPLYSTVELSSCGSYLVFLLFFFLCLPLFFHISCVIVILCFFIFLTILSRSLFLFTPLSTYPYVVVALS